MTMRSSVLCAVAALASIPLASAEYEYELIKRGAECDDGENQKLGDVATVEQCAELCAKTQGCVFFILGKGETKAGWCWAENTRDASCEEGWQIDTYDFYQLKTPGVGGCMEPIAVNYNASATFDDHSCTAADTCFSRNPNNNQCSNCVPSTCTSGNEGYRNPKNDTVYASRVPKDTITIDGDLRDWKFHDTARCYEQVAFANTSGTELVFEEYGGGKWFGPKDFSTKWMMRWGALLRLDLMTSESCSPHHPPAIPPNVTQSSPDRDPPSQTRSSSTSPST